MGISVDGIPLAGLFIIEVEKIALDVLILRGFILSITCDFPEARIIKLGDRNTPDDDKGIVSLFGRPSGRTNDISIFAF